MYNYKDSFYFIILAPYGSYFKDHKITFIHDTYSLNIRFLIKNYFFSQLFMDYHP